MKPDLCTKPRPLLRRSHARHPALSGDVGHLPEVVARKHLVPAAGVHPDSADNGHPVLSVRDRHRPQLRHHQLAEVPVYLLTSPLFGAASCHVVPRPRSGTPSSRQLWTLYVSCVPLSL